VVVVVQLHQELQAQVVQAVAEQEQHQVMLILAQLTQVVAVVERLFQQIQVAQEVAVLLSSHTLAHNYLQAEL
jgi:hypothetical protein